MFAGRDILLIRKDRIRLIGAIRCHAATRTFPGVDDTIAEVKILRESLMQIARRISAAVIQVFERNLCLPQPEMIRNFNDRIAPAR